MLVETGRRREALHGGRGACCSLNMPNGRRGGRSAVVVEAEDVRRIWRNGG